MASEVLMNRTKQVITDALQELLLEKPLDRVTVTDIVNRCGISRNTFYYHFEDMYAAIDWMHAQIVAELTPALGDMSTWRDGVAHVLDFIDANRGVCKAYLESSRGRAYKEVLRSMLEAPLAPMLSDNPAMGNMTEEQRGFVAILLSSAFVAVIEKWFFGEIKLSKSELLELMDQVAPAFIASYPR